MFAKPSLKYIILSATFGSLASLIQPYCNNWILSNALKSLTAIIMIQILHPNVKKQYITGYMLMLTLSYVVGGAILSNLGKSTNSGYQLNNLNLLLAMAIAIISTFIAYKLIGWSKSKITSNSYIYDITFFNNNITLRTKGFIDSGNSLCDNHIPVNLINFDTFSKLTNLTLDDYINNKFNSLNNPHFITANTIAGSRKILVFTINQMQLHNSSIFTYHNVQLGVALHFNNSKEYKVILNSSFCFN